MPGAMTRSLAAEARRLSASAPALRSCAAAPMALTVAVAVEIAPAPRAGLTNGEFGGLALRSLSFRAWQGGTNQRTVDRAFVLLYRWR